MSDDELVAAIDKYLTHESLVKSRRDAFHIVGNWRGNEHKEHSACGIKLKGQGGRWEPCPTHT